MRVRNFGQVGVAVIILVIVLVFGRGVCGVGSPPGPTAAPECALIPDPGKCKGFFRRFYYDRWTGKCCQFIYGGCDGIVPFQFSKDCQAAKCYLMFPGAGAATRGDKDWMDPAYHTSYARATIVIT